MEFYAQVCKKAIAMGMVSGSRIFIGSPEDFYKAAMGAGFVLAGGARSLKFSAGDRYTRGRIRQPASDGLPHLSTQP
jgi:hypothetical protein